MNATHTRELAREVVDVDSVESLIFELRRAKREAKESARLAMEHGCAHGIDDEFWSLVVRATTAEFDAKKYAIDLACARKEVLR